VAAHECISEEALIHLRTYKYSSVDESYISHYILRHYVCSLQRDIEDEDGRE
jgi:ethanolaminephosphotransferase